MRSALPPHRSDELIADLRNNDPRFVRRQTRVYLEYLDRHRSLAPRLCASGVRAWVVFGDNDDVGLKNSERQELEACPTVALITIPDAGHFTLNHSSRARARTRGSDRLGGYPHPLDASIEMGPIAAGTLASVIAVGPGSGGVSVHDCLGRSAAIPSLRSFPVGPGRGCALDDHRRGAPLFRRS